MSNYESPKILNLADLMREAERQREEARKPAVREWIKWPDSFNVGTVTENDAWSRKELVSDFLESCYAFDTYLYADHVTAFRATDSSDSTEFLLRARDGEPERILRAWFDEDPPERCVRVEVRRV